jgi:putative addiction module killer protein
VFEIEEYLDADGRSPFAEWLNSLDAVTAARITTVLHRLEQGNPGDVEPVGEGVSERRMDFGPGYRLYFGSAKSPSRTSIVLLGGGSKRRQQHDIRKAKRCWKDYRRRQREE